jgi:hypothetical protein
LVLRREDLDELVAAWRAASGRLAGAVVAAGFLVGLPLVAITRPPPGWRSLALLWFLGGSSRSWCCSGGCSSAP